MKHLHKSLLILFYLFLIIPASSQDTEQRTYCNPVNLDYTYMIYNAHNDLSYRSGADPAIVEFRNEYYLFITRSMGYWHSTDLLHWNFIEPEQWFFMGSNAPAAHNYKDSVIYLVADPSGSNSVLYSDDPKNGIWKATPALLGSRLSSNWWFLLFNLA
ncbi:hypothetical protein KUV50_18515 [Membranicola marinus]|uniref:Glycosyl hydrolases family 43 n=1 Tax=Membranihabitans marinus TaxID=1227546 RepID=A0A953HYK5_9BACT|nr:hypothetical protein [Membranihabitans marinus]MBY5960153.1 hypothetical protein [Membranihabitans marinus]